MSTLFLYLCIAFPLAGLIHEGGHYLAALLLTGKKLHFKFRLGWLRLGWLRLGRLGLGRVKIPIPRFTWSMPWTPDRWRRVTIALAGFGLELLVAVVLMAIAPRWTFSVAYTLASFIHLSLYRFYAGEASDFLWLW